MPPVCRKGDVCTGHADWPSRPNDQGSPNVFVNGIPAHRKTDHWITHCNSVPACHDSTASKGSSNVFVNGLDIMRIGDPVACGSSVATGSPNVFAN